MQRRSGKAKLWCFSTTKHMENITFTNFCLGKNSFFDFPKIMFLTFFERFRAISAVDHLANPTKSTSKVTHALGRMQRRSGKAKLWCFSITKHMKNKTLTNFCLDKNSFLKKNFEKKNHVFNVFWRFSSYFSCWTSHEPDTKYIQSHSRLGEHAMAIRKSETMMVFNHKTHGK